jgi:hypothetical protein
MHWMVKFALTCAALIVLGLLVVWAFDGFRSLGVEGHVAVAMFLGIFFTILVSVVLMALIFYSHRAGYDAAAQEDVTPAASEPTDPRKPDHDVSLPGA